MTDHEDYLSPLRDVLEAQQRLEEELQTLRARFALLARRAMAAGISGTKIAHGLGMSKQALHGRLHRRRGRG